LESDEVLTKSWLKVEENRSFSGFRLAKSIEFAIRFTIHDSRFPISDLIR